MTKVHITITVDDELVKLANENRINVSGTINWLLRDYLQKKLPEKTAEEKAKKEEENKLEGERIKAEMERRIEEYTKTFKSFFEVTDEEAESLGKEFHETRWEKGITIFDLGKERGFKEKDANP